MQVMLGIDDRKLVQMGYDTYPSKIERVKNKFQQLCPAIAAAGAAALVAITGFLYMAAQSAVSSEQTWEDSP